MKVGTKSLLIIWPDRDFAHDMNIDQARILIFQALDPDVITDLPGNQQVRVLMINPSSICISLPCNR
jgi:hypothetical protein